MRLTWLVFGRVGAFDRFDALDANGLVFGRVGALDRFDGFDVFGAPSGW